MTMDTVRHYDGASTAKVILVILGMALLLSLIWTPVFALDIPSGTPYDMASIPCDGFVGFLDTDGVPENGAEVMLVYRMDEDNPRAVVLYHPGDGGGFKQAAVQFPGGPEVHFTTLESFTKAFPDPCSIVTRESL